MSISLDRARRAEGRPPARNEIVRARATGRHGTRTSWPNRYGTPLYVYDLDVIERQVAALRAVPAARRRARLRGQGQPGAGRRRPPRPARSRRRRRVRRRARNWPTGPGSGRTAS